MSTVCAAGSAPPWVAVNDRLLLETESTGCGGGRPAAQATGVVMSAATSAGESARL